MLLNNEKLGILEDFLKDYETKLTGSYIAKKNRFNQKSVSNFLKELEKENILKSAMQGKNKLYSLNLDNYPAIIDFLSAVEHLKTLSFYKKHALIKEIAGKILPYCKGIVAIFGSYAKSIEKGRSDLDIFIAGTCNKVKVEEFSKIYRIDINTRIYPLSLFKKALKERDLFIEEVMQNHIVIKNSQEFASSVREFRYGKD